MEELVGLAFLLGPAGACLVLPMALVMLLNSPESRSRLLLASFGLSVAAWVVWFGLFGELFIQEHNLADPSRRLELAHDIAILICAVGVVALTATMKASLRPAVDVRL
jgi:hypothetical protein